MPAPPHTLARITREALVSARRGSRLPSAAIEASAVIAAPIGGSAPAVAAGAMPYKTTYAYHVADPVVLAEARPCPRKHCVTWASYDDGA